MVFLDGDFVLILMLLVFRLLQLVANLAGAKDDISPS